ncbi:IclR family transcriptional regulator [Acidaminococcus sp. AM05-11]|uniref:IclR family transcriptional regulator n=1 Tax=Acidaminococcus sp. AM05-11 TaxID=2291997 RepID=UPI000E47D406|nr:IclR family transcriptional regulator [Acidaminococcus sp. AM05-11]RHK01018.1 IclR family transcriptional regulator [Acidaminococcus sp. AM05-11]
METTPLVHSVLHATRLLELYAAQRKESLSLTEISQALGLHKTTVYRLLRTLQYAGWIEQSAKSSRYRLGTGILLVASAVSVHNTTREILSEEMHRLANQFNETVVLSVLLGHTGICADMAKSRHTLGLARERGYLVPLDQGASGKTLLAAQPPELRDSIIQEIGGDRTQQRLLKNQLLHILQTGYCISEGEVDPGIAAVAVPLVMKDRIYALSISGPLERLKALGYTQLADGLLLAAQRLEQKSALLSD